MNTTQQPAIDQLPMALTPSRENLADEALAAYQFGEGVTVVEQDNWNTDDSADYTKIVYVEYDEDAPGADSHKVSFHVRFNLDGSIDDVYGLEMERGNDIGCRGDLPEKPAKQPTYSVAQVESEGVQATGTFYGVSRKGWIMNACDFVDYAGYAQIVIPVVDGVDVKRDIWHPASATESDKAYHQANVSPINALINGALAAYGAHLNEDAYIVRGAKVLGVRIVAKGKRLRFESGSSTLLASGPINPETVAKFVESFWFWSKTV